MDNDNVRVYDNYSDFNEADNKIVNDTLKKTVEYLRTKKELILNTDSKRISRCVCERISKLLFPYVALIGFVEETNAYKITKMTYAELRDEVIKKENENRGIE